MMVFPQSSFDPDTVRILTQAYEDALTALADRTDMPAHALRREVARAVIHEAMQGERDPARICRIVAARALAELTERAAQKV